MKSLRPWRQQQQEEEPWTEVVAARQPSSSLLGSVTSSNPWQQQQPQWKRIRCSVRLATFERQTWQQQRGWSCAGTVPLVRRQWQRQLPKDVQCKRASSKGGR